MKIGFISEPTEAERLFAMVMDENRELLLNLDATQRKLIKAEDKLAKAKAQIIEMGGDVSELRVETEDNKENISTCFEGIAETFEMTDDNTENINTCLEAVAEIYEMITE